METVRRRTDNTASSSVPQGTSVDSTPMKSRTAIPQDHGSSDDLQKGRDVVKINQTNYKFELLFLYSIPIVSLISFGGRMSLLVSCFGGLICYIFDLAGSIEGTLFTLLITAMGIMISLLWAAREFLSKSALNFSFIILVGIVLCKLYLLLSGFFPGIQNEFGPLLLTLESVATSTTPLIASALLAWFMCSEIPMLDIVTFFSISYFLYASILCRPRYTSSTGVSGKKIDTASNGNDTTLLIPLSTMKIVYVIPVVVSLVVHLAVHHNVLSTGTTRIINILFAVLLPVLLMSICASQQLEYWPSEQRGKVQVRLRVLIYATCGALTLIGHHHPVFDEIKSFSGFAEPLPSILLVGSAFSGVLALFLFRLKSKLQKFKDDEDTSVFMSSTSSRRMDGYAFLISILVSGAVGVSALLVALLVNIPTKALPACVFGAVSLAEVYHRRSWSAVPQLMLVIIAGLSIAIVSMSFVSNTIYFVRFDFYWMNTQLSMKQFCKGFSIMLLLSAVIPTLTIQQDQRKSTTLLPSSASGSLMGPSHPKELVTNNIGLTIVEYLTGLVALVFAATELMIREQDWSALEVDVETIYPSYYLIITAMFMFMTVYSLVASKLMGYSTLWIVVVIEACKVLHLAGLRSSTAFAAAVFILAYSMPFVRHISVSIQNEEAKSTSQSYLSFFNAYGGGESSQPPTSTITYLEILLYVVGAGAITFASRGIVISPLLAAVLGEDVSDSQAALVGLAVFFVYVSSLLFVFYRGARAIRSALMTASLLLLVVTCNGLGKFTLSVDPSSSFYLTMNLHPELAESDHSGLFLFVSAGLVFIASVGIIPLRSSSVNLILVSVLFGFTSAKASLGWAFPLSMGGSEYLSHEIRRFPFVFVFTCNLLAAIIGFWPVSALLNSQFHFRVFSWVYSGFAGIPFLATLVATVTDMFGECIQGIAFHSALVYAIVCLATRWKELSTDVKKLSDSASPSARSILSAMSDFPVLFALMAILWTVILSIFSPSVDRDVAIPMSTLLIVFTSQNRIFKGTKNIAIAASLASIWWLSSGLYSVFISNFSADWWNPAGDILSSAEFRRSTFVGTGLFPDEDVSLWSEGISWITVVVHVALMLVPLPGLLLGLLLKRKEDSEEVFFVLAAVSSLSLIGAQINSVRYLGIVGALSSAARCYEISATNRQRDRLI